MAPRAKDSSRDGFPFASRRQADERAKRRECQVSADTSPRNWLVIFRRTREVWLLGDSRWPFHHSGTDSRVVVFVQLYTTDEFSPTVLDPQSYVGGPQHGQTSRFSVYAVARYTSSLYTATKSELANVSDTGGPMGHQMVLREIRCATSTINTFDAIQ